MAAVVPEAPQDEKPTTSCVKKVHSCAAVLLTVGAVASIIVCVSLWVQTNDSDYRQAAICTIWRVAVIYAHT